MNSTIILLKKVEIIILPYENINKSNAEAKKSLKGTLEKHQNRELLSKESKALANAVTELHLMLLKKP